MKEILGILGGGQLGRMMIQSAIDFNIQVRVLDPAKDAPCSAIAHYFEIGDLQDFDTVYAFGKQCDILTIEIEKVNTQALKKLRDEGVKVYPQPEVIELIQDKRLQKQFYLENKIPSSEFILVENKDDVSTHTNFLPAVNKLGKDGYDGKGVQILKNKNDISKAFDAAGILEKLVDIDKEIAVIVARNSKSEVCTFPAVEMVFHPEANLVEYLFSPAQIQDSKAKIAESLAISIIEKLDMVGLLAVEMFITKSGEILINEIAPRPHNSGHQSIEGNITSQFEQHLRAIFGLPLGDTKIILPSAMINLLGEEGYSGPVEYQGLEEILSLSAVHLHLYGKNKTQSFRKMGHITVTDDNIETLKEKALYVKNTFKIISK
jgi:5-(carboxyamino)imidazole ribonucleotide synthase